MPKSSQLFLTLLSASLRQVRMLVVQCHICSATQCSVASRHSWHSAGSASLSFSAKFVLRRRTVQQHAARHSVTACRSLMSLTSQCADTDVDVKLSMASFCVSHLLALAIRCNSNQRLFAESAAFVRLLRTLPASCGAVDTLQELMEIACALASLSCCMHHLFGWCACVASPWVVLSVLNLQADALSY